MTMFFLFPWWSDRLYSDAFSTYGAAPSAPLLLIGRSIFYRSSRIAWSSLPSLFVRRELVAYLGEGDPWLFPPFFFYPELINFFGLVFLRP